MNSFGTNFKFTTWGESHGLSIGCDIEGVPVGITLDESDIQPFLDKRKPGAIKLTSQRKEDDKVEILSGVKNSKTTGKTISLEIKNTNAKPKDYDEIKNKFRPGHADYTYFMKYGKPISSGGGRASGRETASWVAAGAVARKLLPIDIEIKSALIQIGEHKINRSNWDWAETTQNELRCPDKGMTPIWENYIKQIRKEGSSIGSMIELVATNVPIGLGEPIFGKLDAKIASAIMAIPAVKSVEIGSGIEVANLRGEENADEIRIKDNKPHFLSNNAGGVLGGISTGQDIVVRLAVKPASSILKTLRTINTDFEEVEISTKGRHDPCIGIRAAPVSEAMLACVLADLILISS